MSKGDRLGEFEEQVLLGLAAANEDAHGRTIYQQIVEATGRDPSITAVHVTLARLEKKGLVEARMGYPADTGDSRARKMYTLTASGAEALLSSRQAYEELWGAAAAHPRLQSR